MGPPTLFTIPGLRYMKTYGLSHEQLAMVSVVQREWAAKNPRATFKTPITVEDVLNSRMIAYPFRLLQCCLVTDGGGALILVAAERARDFPQKLAPGLNRGRSTCSAPARASRRRWSGRSRAHVSERMRNGSDVFAALPAVLREEGTVLLGANFGERAGRCFQRVGYKPVVTHDSGPFHLRLVANEVAFKAAEYGVSIPNVHLLLHTAPSDSERHRSRHGLRSTSE
jgi:hypothetical protein